jgi:hypothetical protein
VLIGVSVCVRGAMLVVFMCSREVFLDCLYYPSCRLTAANVRPYINRNTIFVYTSAPTCVRLRGPLAPLSVNAGA